MNFLIPFGTEILLGAIKELIKSKHVAQWYENCVGCMSGDYDEGEHQDESPTLRACKHPRYRKAMMEWEQVDSLYKAIKWHEEYTPGLRLEQYIHHYYPKNII